MNPTTATRVSQIVSRMMAYRGWQDKVLLEYDARRRFRASSERFNLDSTMDVETVFHRPDSMQSTVLSGEGSSFVREHVFDKILETESEPSADAAKTDVTPDNYDFAWIGGDDCGGRPCWRLRLVPKRKDKFLIDGDVWIDAQDYAICRIHGTPSKRISMWVSNAEIDRSYRQYGHLWLSDKIQSSTDIMMAGHVTVSIEYQYDKVTVDNGTGS